MFKDDHTKHYTLKMKHKLKIHIQHLIPKNVKYTQLLFYNLLFKQINNKWTYMYSKSEKELVIHKIHWELANKNQYMRIEKHQNNWEQK